MTNVWLMTRPLRRTFTYCTANNTQEEHSRTANNTQEEHSRNPVKVSFLEMLESFKVMIQEEHSRTANNTQEHSRKPVKVLFSEMLELLKVMIQGYDQ
ncbi:6414_t:CDS:2, partial [Gigaspora rosea]